MPLEIGFTPEDIRFLKNKEPNHPLLNDEVSLLSKSLPLKFRGYLKEAGIHNGKIDFLRLPDEGILYGSGRIPIVVTEPRGRVSILKEYDVYSKKREQKILRKVSGILAPTVRFFGNAFYLEELVDPEQNTSLLSLARRGKKTEAIRLEAMAHAQLAKLGVAYDHNHTFDEINIGSDGFRITDFGTSRLLVPPSRSAWLKRQVDEVKTYGELDLLQRFSPLNGNANVLEYALQKLKKISRTPADLVNHFQTLKYSAMNLKRWYAEEEHTNNPWRDTINEFPVIVDTYTNEFAHGRYPENAVSLWRNATQ